MQTELLVHLPSVICNIVVSYHLFVEIKTTIWKTSFIHAIPHNDDYFFAISHDTFYRCCTRTMNSTRLFSRRDLIYLIRVDANRLGILSRNGIFIWHISSHHFTHCKRQLNHIYSDIITVFQNSIYFGDDCRVYQYDTIEHKLTHMDYTSHVGAVRAFQSTLIVQTMESFHYIGPTLDPMVGSIIEPYGTRCSLLPYDEGIIVREYAVRGSQLIFGQWVEGGPMDQFMRLPDKEYVGVHTFDLAFYVQQQPVYKMRVSEQLIEDCFVANHQIFCLVYSRFIVIG